MRLVRKETATSAALKTGGGSVYLCELTGAAAGSSVSATFYDNASAASGTVIARCVTTVAGPQGDRNDFGGDQRCVEFSNGLYVAIAGTGMAAAYLKTDA